MDEIIRQATTILRGMWKHRWLGLVVAWAVCVIAVVVILRIPDKYEASARIYVDTQSILKPLPEVTRRTDQIISTASADVTMKGQRYLLEALAKIRTTRDVKLVIIGKLKEGSKTQEALERYGLFDAVTFVSGVPDEEIVRLYSESAAAVVPSG